MFARERVAQRTALAVGRAVVDDNDLEGPTSHGRQDFRNQNGEIVRFVLGRNHDRNVQSAHLHVI